MSAVPLPLNSVAAEGDAAALWRCCIDLARRRRQGLSPTDTNTDTELPLAWLPTHGYVLQHGWDHEARTLFALFKPLLDRHGKDADWTVGQLGQSLDGCIATHRGDSRFVNGPEGLLHLHRLRALCDAVIVGAGTVCLDNPQLTTRRVPGDNPTRVVIDPSLRVPADARVFIDEEAPTLLVCDVDHRARAEARLGAAHVVALRRHAALGNRLSVTEVVGALRERGLRLLFVEGGGVTVSQFVQQRCLDRLHLLVAPVVIGAGHPGLQVRRSDAMGDALRPAARTFALGSDVLWDLALDALQQPVSD